MFRSFLVPLIAFATLNVCLKGYAQTIWTGPNITFSKASGADPMSAANQDRITDNVWLTRNSSQGIFNIAAEDFYTNNLSPADTEWAFPFNNPLAQPSDLTATNWGALVFENWETANGGAPSGPPDTVDQPAVLHLVSDNIYLNIMFTEWGGAGGGPFTYERSTAIPEPASLGLIGVAIVVVLGMRAKRT